ncbi:MAG: hypothetical protein Q8R13_02480 [bacterium]|nr:hypothetical protein [bacterium]
MHLFAAVTLLTLVSFALGRLTAPELPKTTPTFTESDAAAQLRTTPHSWGEGDAQPLFVASRNGKYFYLPWCPGVDRIKESNKVTFRSAAEARAAGLEPAANCPGIGDE